MKLYATATSERASKGQGGNDYIDIDLQGEGGELVARFVFMINGAEDIDKKHYILVQDPNIGAYEKMRVALAPKNYKATLKGEKQKGECVHGHVVRETCTDACRTK